MSRMRKFFVPVAAAVVGFAVAAPLISESATPTNDSSTVALSAGGTASITCTGASLSETLQSATSMSIVCNPGVTTPTSAPTSTSTTTSPTTTPTTTPSTTTTTTQPTTPPSGAHSSELGLYNNGTTASQLGVTVQVVSDYAYDPDWTTYAPSGAAAAQGKLLMLAVGALTPAQATAIGTILADNGQPSAIIRPMWEMNQGSWYPLWNENTMSAATYKSTWIAMVDAFRSVPGTDFKFDYDINAGTGNNVNGRSNFDSYPGNAYVDYIGEDVYDNTDSVSAAQAEITEMTDFAQMMRLPWSLPEWGMNGPNDDPAFVNMVSAETNLPSCWEEALFSEPWSSSGLGSNLLDLPNSFAAYESDFASATTTSTTTTSTTTTDPATTTTTTATTDPGSSAGATTTTTDPGTTTTTSAPSSSTGATTTTVPAGAVVSSASSTGSTGGGTSSTGSSSSSTGNTGSSSSSLGGSPPRQDTFFVDGQHEWQFFEFGLHWPRRRCSGPPDRRDRHGRDRCFGATSHCGYRSPSSARIETSVIAGSPGRRLFTSTSRSAMPLHSATEVHSTVSGTTGGRSDSDRLSTAS